MDASSSRIKPSASVFRKEICERRNVHVHLPVFDDNREFSHWSPANYQPRRTTRLLFLLLAAITVLSPSSRANPCTNLPVRPSHHTVLPGQSAAFTAILSSEALVAIQWHQTAGAIPGATNATLTLANVQISQAGLYWATARTVAGVAITSCVVRLTVLDLDASPGFYVAITNAGGSNVAPRLGIFSPGVSPTNNALAFWENADPGVYYGLQLSTALPVFQTVAMSLSRVPPVWLVVSASNAGPNAFYRLEILNAYAPRDSDRDGIDDVYEMEHPDILDPLRFEDASLDPDGNGHTHLEEYIACFNLGTNALQFISREVTTFNFGAPSAQVEVISIEDSVFNFGGPSANVEANSKEVSVYRAVPGSGPPLTDFTHWVSREFTVFNFGAGKVEAISKGVSLYRAVPGSGPPQTDLSHALSREVSMFNFGGPSASVEAISKEVSVFTRIP